MISANLKKFVTNAAILTAASLFMRTVGVSFNAYVSRRIGAEGMGLYTLVMSVYGFSVTFSTSGIHLAVTRLVSEALGRGESRQVSAIMRRALLYVLFFGSIATLCLVFGAGFISERLLRDSRTLWPLRLLGASMLPIGLSTVWSGYFTAVKRVHKNAATAVFEQAVKIFAVIGGLTLLMPRGLSYACVALVAGGALAEMLSCLLLFAEYLIDRRRYGLRAGGAAERGLTRQLLHISLPVAMSAYIRSGLLTVEHLLIPRSLTRGGRTRPQALAEYGVLHGMALPVLLYPTAVLYSASGLLVPEFAERAARGEWASIRALIGRVLWLTNVFSVSAALLLVVFSRELGMLIYHSYEVGDYVRLMAFVLPVMFADHVTDCILKGLGQQVFTMWVNISDSLLSIFLVMLLLPGMGVAGYAWVIIIAEVFNFSFSVGRLAWVSRFPFAWGRGVVLPLFAATLSALAVRCCMPMDPASSSLYWTVMKMLFTVSCYFTTLMLAQPLCQLPLFSTKKGSGALDKQASIG
ncbi:MAG: oligosaccharide flippase family protein [Eubacteriales bacterium]